MLLDKFVARKSLLLDSPFSQLDFSSFKVQTLHHLRDAGDRTGDFLTLLHFPSEWSGVEYLGIGTEAESVLPMMTISAICSRAVGQGEMHS